MSTSNPFEVLNLRTVARNCLGPRHWLFPSFYSQGYTVESSPLQLKWLANAVFYEYAREFESLVELRNREWVWHVNHPKQQSRPTREKLANEHVILGERFDKKGHWLFFGETDPVDHVDAATPSVPPAKWLVENQWAVSLNASADFPDKPFDVTSYEDSEPLPKDHPPGLIIIKPMAVKEGNRALKVENPAGSYYQILIDWGLSDKEIVRRFAQWVKQRPARKRANLQGRAPERELELDLKSLGILRLCCEHGSVPAAQRFVRNAPGLRRAEKLYARTDDWINACRRAIRLLGQWGLLVQTVAHEITKQSAQKAVESGGPLPLEIVAFNMAKDLSQGFGPRSTHTSRTSLPRKGKRATS
jgi:hypothetical protein